MPRLSINLDDDLNKRLDKFLPWGTKQTVMVALCELLCISVEKHGKKLVGLLLNKEFNFITNEILAKPELEVEDAP